MATMDERIDVSKKSMQEMGAATGDKIADAAEQAGVVAQQQMDRLADAIRRKPVQAAGIAAGLGFVLALLARR